MKDPKRISRVLKLIKQIWEKYPNLRLTQLLGNCFKPGDNYYIEDEELLVKLKEIYDEKAN